MTYPLLLRDESVISALNAESCHYLEIPYFPGLSEKIRRSLIPHGVKTIMKPGTKLGQILSSHKDKIQSNKRQGAI